VLSFHGNTTPVHKQMVAQALVGRGSKAKLTACCFLLAPNECQINQFVPVKGVLGSQSRPKRVPKDAKGPPNDPKEVQASVSKPRGATKDTAAQVSF
jgi:hypothetical protein